MNEPNSETIHIPSIIRWYVWFLNLAVVSALTSTWQKVIDFKEYNAWYICTYRYCFILIIHIHFQNHNILGKSKIRKKKTKPLNYYLKK